jgi:glucosamine--fructose-6-phosphate aminotransferase (isomerizing)
MCGIFGIISNTSENVYDSIIQGLIQLQNRGYDSSGFCVYSKEQLCLYKYASTDTMTSIDKLKSLNLTNSEKDTHWIGIGHNRWATHGGKTDINSHPHLSNDGKIAIVHNGIIENYQEIKTMLQSNGFHFHSQTDTEVIVNLISYYLFTDTESKNNSKMSAIEKTILHLQGTYGIILLFQDQPDTLYCFKNGSPILIGENDNSIIITSEQSGFCNRINHYIILNNDDICIIHKNRENKIKIKTSHSYLHKPITCFAENKTPYPFLHWTLKEIFDQPNTIINAMNRGGRIKNSQEVKLGGLEPYTDIIKQIDNIILLGCGTSYHSGLYGAFFLKSLCNFNTIQVIDGAEFNSHDIPKIGKTACIFISQSGETKDLHRCIQITKEHNLFTIGIINVVDSLIAREVQCGIYCNAGKEIGVASTKSFTSQVICLSLFSIWCAQIHQLNETKRLRMIHDLHNLSKDFKTILEEIHNEIKVIAREYIHFQHMFLLGKGTDEYIAKEGSLKIKEITYIHSEAYSSSALKHGPFALLDEHLPTILFDCCEEHHMKNQNCFEEIYSRNSPIILITNITNTNVYENRCKIIKLPNHSIYSSLFSIIPIQLLGYYISIYKNINPDIPKNLAKVVTVE